MLKLDHNTPVLLKSYKENLITIEFSITDLNGDVVILFSQPTTNYIISVFTKNVLSLIFPLIIYALKYFCKQTNTGLS